MLQGRCADFIGCVLTYRWVAPRPAVHAGARCPAWLRGTAGQRAGRRVPAGDVERQRMDICSIDRYLRAAQETGSLAKCRCIARSRSALSKAAMIID